MSQHQQPPDETTQLTDTDPEPSTEIADAVDQHDVHRYQCSICGETYGNEITARVHITRSDDVEHLNHNGLMPEAEIELVSPVDEVVDTISRQPDEIAVESFSVEQLPDDYSNHHRQIIKVATHNPYASYAELEDLVASEFEEFDIEVPSYSTIRRVVREFYRPHVNAEQTESLDALTAKQQAIIIARLILEDKTHANVSERVGCAASYPAQVYERAAGVVQKFEEADEDVVGLIKSELSTESISELINRGLVDDLPIEFEQIDDNATENASTDDNDDSYNQQSLWGSPVDNQTGLRGVPADLTDTAYDGEDQAELVEESGDPKDSDSGLQDSLGSDDALQADITDLYHQIRLLEDVFQQVDSDYNADLTEAVITEVAKRCESILHTQEEK